MPNKITNDIFIHIPQEEVSLNDLCHELYSDPTPKLVEHLKLINPHLTQRVLPGQIVILSPPEKQTNAASVNELIQMAKRLDQSQKSLTPSERKILAKHYELLANIADLSGAGYGVGMNYFTQHKKYVETILRDIEKEYVHAYRQHGNLHNAAFLRRRQVLFMKLRNALNRMAGRKVMGLDLDAEHIKRSLGLNTKSIIKQWKTQVEPVQGIEGFEENFAKVGKYTKVLKHAGYVGIVLDVGQSADKIHEACTLGTKNDCTRSKYRQGGRLLGSTSGGLIGGELASYLTCNLVFGLESGGTSLLWCGIVAGGVGGYFGGKYGGVAMKKTGDVLYQYTSNGH